MSQQIMDALMDAEKLEQSLYTLHDIYRKHQEYIKTKHHVSALELEIIQLVESGGKKKMKEIGEHFHIKLSTLTSIIDKIEQQNLIRRTNSKEDRRVVYLEITRNGQKLYEDYSDYIHIISDLMYQEMPADKFGGFVDGLEKISALITGVSKK